MNNPFGVDISRNAIILGGFALLTVGLVVLTANQTKAPIQAAKQRALTEQLSEVFPPHLHDNQLSEHTVTLQPNKLLANKDPRQGYIATLTNAATPNAPHYAGTLLPVTAPDGYGGAIDLLVGIDQKGTITGVRVIPPHNETPGLGDAIEIKKSPWILAFTGKSLDNLTKAQWAVKQDGGVFDAFAGATITPRAVVNAVYNALQYNQEHPYQHKAPAND